MAEISTKAWEEILQSVKQEFDITEVTYRTWLAPLRIYELRNDTVVILVTTGQMGIDYISKKFMFPLKVAIAEITGTEYDIEFILPESVNGETTRKTEAERAEISSSNNNDKAIDRKMEDTIKRVDAFAERYDRARFRSVLVLTLFGAVSLMAIWLGQRRHDK